MIVDVLFAVFGSGVDVVTVAVFESVAPAPAVTSPVMTSWTVAPGRSVPKVPVTVPLCPTGGPVQVRYEWNGSSVDTIGTIPVEVTG